jgi:AcrR family transcriptional regulator
MNTKEKISYEALNLFSIRGFDAVSVRDIAGAVGIKESSLYNHYKSKQDIFESIVQQYSERGNDFFHSINMLDDGKTFAVDERTISMYKVMSPAQFEALSLQILEYYLTDDIIVKFRKMLTIEQYRNKKLTQLYREISFNGSLEFQSQLFSVLMNEGFFIKTDPYVLALEFFSPIFLMFYKFDSDENGLSEAKKLMEKHVRHFNQTYGTNNN